jgi:hypothetical protein
MKLMELAAKHKSAFARQLLIDRGFPEVQPDTKQLSLGNHGTPNQGGNHDK